MFNSWCIQWSWTQSAVQKQEYVGDNFWALGRGSAVQFCLTVVFDTIKCLFVNFKQNEVSNYISTFMLIMWFNIKTVQTDFLLNATLCKYCYPTI